MHDDDAARRKARMWGLASVLSAGLAAQAATAWADEATPASAQPGEFVETPVGPAAPAPAATATPASSGELVEQPVDAATAATAAPTSATGSGPFGFLSTASRSSNLLGDMWGLRPFLSKYGMTLTVVENSELFGNLSGGVRQGFEYNGLTTATLQLDTQRAFGLNGGRSTPAPCRFMAAISAPQTSTRCRRRAASRPIAPPGCGSFGISRSSAMTLDVKVGQQSLDQEFMVSQNASYFVNTMFGWPMLPSADLPGGGPAYPLSALGVRARAHVSDTVTILAGVFNGSPAPNTIGDPQKSESLRRELPAQRRRAGDRRVAIHLSRIGHPGEGGTRKTRSRALTRSASGTTARDFADLRYDRQRPLARQLPAAGAPATHRGDYAILRGRGPDDLARRRPGSQHQRLRPADVHAAPGSQPHRLQPQRAA